MNEHDKGGIDMYVIEEYGNYNDIHLNVTVAEVHGSENGANKLAEELGAKVFLYTDSIKIVTTTHEIVIENHEKDKYQFEVCTKQLEPIPLERMQSMSQEELERTFKEYMITEEDMKPLKWDIKEAFQHLTNLYEPKLFYKFDSLSYGVKEKK